MGVHPEPARCADDVSRLVPTGSDDVNNIRLVRQRPHKSTLFLAILRGHVRASLMLGLVFSCSPSTTFANGRIGEVAMMPMPIVTRPAEWGGEVLGSQGALTQAVLDNHPARSLQSKRDGEALQFGDTSVPRPLAATIVRASQATGVDPVFMMALADKESSFNTDVKSSKSSAQGLFQFVTGTWLEMIRDFGARHGLTAEAAAVKGRGNAISVPDRAMRKHVLDLRNDPFVSGLMAGELIRRDRTQIEGRVGRELKTTELYIAHFLGTASASKLLTLSAEDPERNAQKVFGRAARANRSIFTMRDGGKNRSLTVGEVHERLDSMIDRRIDQYQAIASMIAAEAEMAGEDAGDERPLLDARLRLKDDDAASPLLVAPAIH